MCRAEDPLFQAYLPVLMGIVSRVSTNDPGTSASYTDKYAHSYTRGHSYTHIRYIIGCKDTQLVTVSFVLYCFNFVHF